MAGEYIELKDIEKNKRQQEYNNLKVKLKSKLMTAASRMKTAGTFVLQKTKEANERYQATQSKPKQKGRTFLGLGIGLRIK